MYSNVLTTITLAYLALANGQPATRGVPRSRLALYAPDKPFSCLNGEKTIAHSEVNDDFCDCADGSDEPGTSACGKTIFYCQNKGAKALEFPSYRVNDGICDCCDGTDEYDGSKDCPNNCQEAGRALREAAVEERRVATAGFAIRKQNAKGGAQVRATKETELQGLKEIQARMQTSYDVAKTAKETAEAPEKEAKGYFDSNWETEKAEREEAAVKNLFTKLDADASGGITALEIQAELAFDGDSSGDVSEEEATGILDVDGDGATNETEANVEYDWFKEELFENIKDKFEMTTVDTTKPEYDEDIQQLINAAEATRTKFTAIEDEKKETDTKISTIEGELAHDWGLDNAFAYMIGNCYSVDVSTYTYKVCPFSDSKQEPKGGGGSTSLGTYKGFTGEGEKKYLEIKFEGGQKCWNGPQRSMKVTLKCGAETTMSSVIEPSMCEYESIMTTPAVCNEPGPENHDEL